MKKLILLFALTIICACTKTEPAAQTCKVCDVNVQRNQTGTAQQNYIESSTTYCNGEWVALDGKTTTIGQGFAGGVYVTTTKTTHCH